MIHNSHQASTHSETEHHFTQNTFIKIVPDPEQSCVTNALESQPQHLD